jgi:hypothetical protein
MKTAPVLDRRAPVRLRSSPSAKAGPRDVRSVPNLSAAEEAFLGGIGSSGSFTLSSALKMYEAVPALRRGK